MEWTDLLARWKELGAVGVVIIVLAKLGDKAFIWMLDALGVKIKRTQSREDTLGETVAKMRIELDSLNKRVTKVEGAYDIAAVICHKAAEGIDKELRRLSMDCPTIQFFVDQLRTVQAIEEVLKD